VAFLLSDFKTTDNWRDYVDDAYKAKIYDEFEQSYWWFIGRRKIVSQKLQKYADDKGRKMLADLGCGSGANLMLFSEFFDVVGVDVSYNRLLYCKEKGLRNLIQSDVCLLPFKDGVLDVVAALDIIEHIENDEHLLSSIQRMLKHEGVLILTVPAYQFLLSPYADAGHKRRYSKRELRKRIEKGGYKILEIGYFNSMLFPLMMIERFYQKFILKKGKPFDVVLKRLPGWLNKTFTVIFKCEAAIIAHGLNMPFGGSIYALCQKRKTLA
jgi:SAM-dependent methyltransferase